MRRQEIDRVATETGPTTVAELLARCDDGRWEIVAGLPRYRPGASWEHATTVSRLMQAIGGKADGDGLGVVGPALSILLADDPATVLVADIAFLRATNLPHEMGGIPVVVPDLVAEVLSPADTAVDLDEKLDLYLHVGVRLVWIVNPKRRTVTAYAADGTVRSLLPGGVLDGGDVLPGFALPVDRIFA